MTTVFKGALLTIALAAPCAPLPAMAQEADPMVFCEYQPSPEDLVGVYTVTTGPSVLRSGGRSLPLPNIQTHQSTLAMIDGTLVLYADDTQAIELHPVADDEPDWSGPDTIGGTPVVSTDDIGLMLGCDVNTLVRLMGTGTATSQEGRQFEFTIRLFAASNGTLVGGQSSWSVDGMTMTQRLILEEAGN
jgi:hypothetical protein|tara:strand:- start:65189 stop:65755 length:567 start_codon:yes stop_codon:yes gene_type:complete